MTEILQYDSVRTNRSYDERDAIIGAMFITAVQWIEADGFGLNRNMLFTNSQNRIMGVMLRELAENSVDTYYSIRMKELYDILNYYSTQGFTLSENGLSTAVYSLQERINLWNLVDQAATAEAGDKALIHVLDTVISNNGLYNKFYWLIDVIKQLEVCMDKGIYIGDLVSDFIGRIPQSVVIKNNNYNNEEIHIVAESNTAYIYLDETGIWKVKDSVIVIDRLNADALQQYNDSRPFINVVPGSNGQGEWKTDYFPLHVKQKDLVSRDRPTYVLDGFYYGNYFPFLSFNNRTFQLTASIASQSTAVSTEEDVPNLDVTLNGLMPVDNNQRRIVVNIAGLSFFNGVDANENRHYFHCKNVNPDYDEIIELNSLFDLSQNVPSELPATNHLMDACTLTGTIFSIDPIRLVDFTALLECLLITGNFTLTETSTSNVFTNVAIWNPRTKTFLEYTTDDSINNFVTNAANFFANEELIYKTDSYPNQYFEDPIQHSQVVFGFSRKLDNNSDVVTNGLFDMSGPFFIVDAISQMDPDTHVTSVKLNFILPKDIKGMKEDINNYQNWLTGITSYTVQKISGGDFIGSYNAYTLSNINEVKLYTGKGIFFLDLHNLRISDRSFHYPDDNGNPSLLYKIPVEGLNGEVSNFHEWVHPNTHKENATDYNLSVSTFIDSFTRFESIDDRLNSYNTIELTSQEIQNSNPNTHYVNSVRLMVASGWSKLGNLANTPADYNNIFVDTSNTPTVNLSKDPNDTLIDVSQSSGNKVAFAKQTKLILAKIENQVENYNSFGEGWINSANVPFYSFQEVELPMGYGELLYGAYLARKVPYNP